MAAIDTFSFVLLIIFVHVLLIRRVTFCSQSCICSFTPLFSFLQFSIFGSRTVGRTIRRVAGDEGVRCGLSKAEFMEKVQQSNEACQRGDFHAAVHLYSDALEADPQNCILYSNRSAALLKLGQHQAALDDAAKARALNPKWPKVRAPEQLYLKDAWGW